MMKTEALKLVQEWDKTFPKSDKVDHSKVTFVNHFGITLAADNRSVRTFWSLQRAVLRPVCAGDGRARISHNCF